MRGFALSLAHWTSLAFPGCHVRIAVWMLPRGSFERMVLDSAAGNATATFLNCEIVFHGISLKPRVEKQKPAETSMGSLEASTENSRETWKTLAKSTASPKAAEVGSFQRTTLETSGIAMEASWKASAKSTTSLGEPEVLESSNLPQEASKIGEMEGTSEVS